MPIQSFLVSCAVCCKTFKTSAALSKHWKLCHPHRKEPVELTFSLDGKEAKFPKRLQLIRHSAAYKTWVSALTTRMKNAHHPRCKAKWHNLEFHYVPQTFFTRFLRDLGKPRVNSVKQTHHWRAPIMTASATKESYKVYDAEQLLGALRKGDKILPLNMSWKGEEVCNEVQPEDIDDPVLAIAAAKERAYQNSSSRISCRSSIVVGEGHGRATRELEITWWPCLYDGNLECGKMCLRFFVAKVQFF